MKNILMLLLLTACTTMLTPQAKAQADCSWAGMPCSGNKSCGGCHLEIQICTGGSGSQYCYDCYTPCLNLSQEPRRAQLTRFAPTGHTPLTDLGATFLAAVMPDFLRNPLAAGRLPAGHPEIPSTDGERLLARMADRNRAVTAPRCKAPASVQLIAASMVRK